MTTLTEVNGDYVLDAARTRIGFVARHRMATRVRGRFDVFEGAVRLDSDDPARSTAWLTIQANSIETGDRRRDAQLRKSFLDAPAHPVITFVATAVERTGTTTFAVTGDLTIRGVTHPVTVPFELTHVDDDVTFTATLPIDRSRWQVNWNAATTLLVSPTVLLDLQVTASPRG
ncbi:YceI family protein [Kribbella shirazensis]|uniref:Polyisoprenoid-binding protein YceI n=1 Tax=Kribbella shirazensis TaxID=1105143 RepID=A0A7X5ZZ22_9ACTN|nr:YceI family protein [Kribbella shirazensis]NIK54664.1 polyisoprenoid-binding protein YceI [Kribbella shirazensis]